MNSGTDSAGLLPASPNKSKKTSPYSLDLSKLKTHEEKSFANYQKLWSNSDAAPSEIDTLYVCIFCEEPVSPRKKVNIVKKKPKESIKVAGTEPLTKTESPTPNLILGESEGSPLIEYCCLQCSNKIRSYTASPRTAIKSPSSPVFTPRPKPGFNKARSFVKPLLPNGVLSQSWTGGVGGRLATCSTSGHTNIITDLSTVGIPIDSESDSTPETPGTSRTVEKLARRNTDSSVPPMVESPR